MPPIKIKPGIDHVQATDSDLTGTFLKLISQNDQNNEETWIHEYDLKKYIVPDVNNTPIGYVPTASGNTLNLNEFVIDSNGDNWFIDEFGDAVKLKEPTGVGSIIVRKNSGANVGTRPRLNFIEGANITIDVVDDNPDDEIDITITATGAAGGYDTIQEEGSSLTQRTILNFIGSSFTASDDGANTRTNLTAAALLDSIVDQGTNGWIVKTTNTTSAIRELIAASNKISITNTTGVSGNPEFDVVEANININNLNGVLNITKGGTGRDTLGSPNQVLAVNTAGTALEYRTMFGSGGVTVTHSTGSIEVNGSGVGGAGYDRVQEEGSNLPQQTTLNFIGSSITATNNIAQSRTDVTMSAFINSLHDQAGTGILIKVNSTTAATRTLTAGSNKISVANGSGVAGNPTIDVVEANININNLAGTLQVNKGGTGLTALGGPNTFLGVNAAGTALHYKTLTGGAGVSINHSGTTTTISATGSSNWTLSSTTLYPNSTSTNVVIGGTAMSATGLKFQVNGKSYLQNDTFVGAPLDLAASQRGYMNVRMYEGGYGGYGQHSGSGSTHNLTAVQDSAIFSRWFSGTTQTTLVSIGTQANVNPLNLEGIHNNTATQVGAVKINGRKRNTTGAQALLDSELILEVMNNNLPKVQFFGSGRTDFLGNTGIRVPQGTTAQRAAVRGIIRFNTDTLKFEGCTNATGPVYVDLH
jgi:hypothetical protein